MESIIGRAANIHIDNDRPQHLNERVEGPDQEKRLPSELAGFSFDAGRCVTGAAGAGAAGNSPLGEIRTPTGGILSRENWPGSSIMRLSAGFFPRSAWQPEKRVNNRVAKWGDCCQIELSSAK